MSRSILCNKLFALIILVFLASASTRLCLAGGVIIPTGESQADFTNAYKLMLYKSHVDYRFTSGTIDTVLFPKFGEFSIYWARSGDNKGSFIMPDAMPSSYSSVTHSSYDTYDWAGADHYSIQYKSSRQRVAIFLSDILMNNRSVSWEGMYFKNTFDSYLYNNIHYFINEQALDTANISGYTQLLIIPSFALNGDDNKYYIDSVFRLCPDIPDRINAYLAGGGTIYAEGNAAYFIEKLGYLDNDAVDFDNQMYGNPNTNLIGVNFTNSSHPLSFTSPAVEDSLYAISVPQVDAGDAEIIAEIPGFGPVAFVMAADEAGGGRIICNTGLPTVGGINEIQNGSRQLVWTMNAIMSAFAKNIDVTRSVFNDLPDSVTAGKNAVSYDRLDTFEMRILIRNLSSEEISGITIYEKLLYRNIGGKNKTYFEFVDVATPGVDYNSNWYQLTFNNISIPAHSERTIVYRLKTPEPEDKIHEDVDRFIAWRTYVYGTYNVTTYNDNDGKSTFWKTYRNYVDMMFSAKLVADTDVNWKNFLGLFYQPFKVFMIMENKERTSAENTVYTQYIPKDVPFYWSDKSINIPILKTPGGKYVDVLRGSNNEDSPDFDMDSDGHPDAWLDTASIYPKGYTITEDSVYWLNPWEHLRTGNKFYYEDIDHDGKRAEDTDGDGVVDVEEPGDKIRVWKITWNINRVPGYDYADPYCYLELWVDPPELVKLSAGVGYAHDLLDEDVGGMFYPYTPDIDNANLLDTSWSHWMERDENGLVIWKQLIYQSINNYEGFTFIDTAAQNYRLRPTDRVVGTVPQPHREFIAVLSLGGEEIDMTKFTPQQSLYSKLEYNTIFNEQRVTPIRSTYTYYAPLPNPLQFEYLSNNYVVTDYFSGDTLRYLPEHGLANITFDIDASTEYTYYWIRNVGHDVDYNDPSEEIEGIEELGDGVFGYMVYDIPKGMGGYKISLPKKEDGTYDINSIVQVDGGDFKKWLDNPNTKNEIEIWEDPFQYHVYIPQLLIPPALDDDNFDGIDDWIDDRGDRFCSATGFLHDAYMLDNGEDWLDYPEVPFRDDIYGMVDSGWYHGADMTYGDDFFENLGKTKFKINVIYEGMGKEGPVEISKGGWLVVEEIFGGSPWVIFSHVLSGYAEGTDYEVISETNPSVVRFGNDTTFIKHTIYDANEPHYFDAGFDPYHVSYGYGDATITAYVGGRDPCNLIDPPIQMPAIVDPDVDHKEITLIPLADSTNPELSDYPKTIEGTFIQVKVEISNGTDDNWLFTTVTPQLPANLGNTEVAMSYVAYPRPLVPAKVDPATGDVIMGGDDFGTFRTAWRFNQPEGEVIVELGNELSLIQPSRRAYFIFLISIDENLEKGVYDIGFTVSGQRRHYDEQSVAKGGNQIQSAEIKYDAPPIKFAVSDKNSAGTVTEYQKFIIGTGSLKNLKVQTDPSFTGLENVKWSTNNVNHTNFNDMTGSLASNYNSQTGVETIDLSPFDNFPTVENNEFYILQQGEVYSYSEEDKVDVSPYRELSYDAITSGSHTDSIADQIIVTSAGPKIKDYMMISGLNGKKISQGDALVWDSGGEKDIEVMFEVTNHGNTIAEKTILDINPGVSFFAFEESLPENCTIKDGKVEALLGAFYPGETKRFYVHFGATEEACLTLFDETTIVPTVNIAYEGSLGNAQAEKEIFSYEDFTLLDAPVIDFNLTAVKSARPDIALGSYTTITAKFQNGVVNTEDVVVCLFAIINHKDTMLVGEKLVTALEISGAYEFSMDYSIPPDAEFVEIFAEIDAGDTYYEICESNNTKVMILPIQGPNWILNVGNFPNPFTESTTFSYTLPRAVREVSIIVFAVDGTIVDKIMNCPNSYGGHTVPWENSVLSKGTYIYNIIGINNQGEEVKYFGKIKKQ